MDDIFEELENFAWSLGDNPMAMEILAKKYPSASMTIYHVGDFTLPENIITCDGNGEGEIVPVKRLTPTYMETKGYDDKEFVKITFEEFWTSPYAVPWSSRNWDLVFWDSITDEEVQIGIPYVE